jgi:hypothetical protein
LYVIPCLLWMMTDSSRLRTMTSSPSLLLNPSSDIAADVDACIRYIASLESVWQGSQRSRMILQDLWDYTISKNEAPVFDSEMSGLPLE